MDIETDGPVPGPYSMLSIGVCVAGVFDGRTYRRDSSSIRPLYMEIKPVGSEIDLEALRINGLDRERLKAEGLDPAAAMSKLVSWVELAAAGMNPVLVAYPLSFDWPFVSWYMERYGDGASPFGHSSCLDIRTLYLAKAQTLFEDSSKAKMPSSLRPTREHTHNALDDAEEQAELFSNIFVWDRQSSALSLG